MGYCWPCVSLNGGVYFAASTHICIGLFMTGYLTYLYLHSLAHGLDNDYSFLFATFFLYALTVLVLGCFIFSGLEKKSVRILKPAAITFGVLHGLIFLRVIFVTLSKVIYTLTSSIDSTPTANFSKGEIFQGSFGILFFTFLFFAAVIYLALLSMHIRNIETSSKNINIFSQVQLGVSNGDGNPLYAYNPVLCQP